MPTRLPNQLTKPSTEEMFAALGTAWLRCMGGAPKKEQLCVLLAQWAFETGWGQYMHCFNVGNMKSVDGDGRDYTFFKCWELEPEKQAKAHTDPRVSIDEAYGIDAVGRCKVWYSPDHPACRFRAYTTLALGAYDYLVKLMDRYSDDLPEKNAWGAVVHGDPVAFVHAIKLKGYFTGDEQIYTRQVKGIYEVLIKKDFDTSQFVSHTEDEEDQLRNWIISSRMSLDTDDEETPDAPDIS